jgi:CRP-like cAMP-binding protein
MLTTVEKVIALKRAAVFAEVPDEILAELASCLEEVEHGAGQAVFKKGDLGDCMYIIADGRVRIHDGDRTLNDLCAGEVFGEMAVLDAEPRSASATAAVDSLLLRLDQEPLYEVMEDRIEVTRGIVRMLCQRLRARLSDLEQLHTQLER